MNPYQYDLKHEQESLWAWQTKGHIAPNDEDIATAEVLKAYLMDTDCDDAPRMTAEEHNKFPGGRW